MPAAWFNGRRRVETCERPERLWRKADLPALLEPSHGRTGEAEAEQRERGGFGNRCGLHQIQSYVVDIVKRSVGVWVPDRVIRMRS